MKIGIFGGTFNPIHNGHIKAAELAKEITKLDEVWFIPTKITPDKTFNVEPMSNIHRVMIIKAALIENEMKWAKIKTDELTKNRISYSYQTVVALKEQYPSHKFYFIMGDDRYSLVKQWKYYNKFRNAIDGIIVLGRNKIKINLIDKSDKFISDGILKMSSSETLNRFLWDNIPFDTKKYIAKNYLFLKTLVFLQLHNERYQHVTSVASHAKRLAAKTLFVSKKKAYIAGLTHDMFKLLPIGEQKAIVKKYEPEWVLPEDPAVHGYSTAAWLKNVYLLKDEKILNAIKRHTISSPNATKLDKIIFVADKISSDRKGSKTGALRRLAYSNLNLTYVKILKNQIKKLNKRGVKPSIETLEAYDKFSGVKHAKIKKVSRTNK